VVEWFAFGVSLVSLAVSVAAYRSGIPRLKVSASGPAMLVGDVEPGPRFGIIVTVVNDGGKAARITSVQLVAAGVVGRPIRGPRHPVVLEAAGDQQTWIFDAQDLSRQLGEQVRTQFRDPTEPLLMRATVRTGSKTIQSGTVQVNPPGVATARQTRRQRWKRRYQSWFRPSAFILACFPTAEELDLRTHRVMINNTGRGVLPASELVLTVWHADGGRELVQDYEPVGVPRIFGGRSKFVEVSLVDDSRATPGDTYYWVLRLRDFLHWGQPATTFTISQVPDLKARLDTQNTPPANAK
jgi:hypothetical protein